MTSDAIIEPNVSAPLKTDVIELVSRAFGDLNPAICAISFFNSRYQVDYSLVTMRHNDNVVAAAFFGVRTIRWFGRLVRALTVGPLAVHPFWQHKGYGGRLLAKVEIAAKEVGAELIYLQGISGYYRKFGFIPIPVKSKVVVRNRPERLNSSSFVRAMRYTDIPAVSALYNRVAQGVNFSAIRTLQNWEWLLTFGKDTWYFSNPHVLVSENEIVGYFCIDSADKARVREFLSYAEYDAIDIAIEGMFSKLSANEVRPLEIMTWHSSSLMAAVLRSYDADFIRYIRYNSGQLIKPLTNLASSELRQLLENDSSQITAAGLSKSFIFQGDNF